MAQRLHGGLVPDWWARCLRQCCSDHDSAMQKRKSETSRNRTAFHLASVTLLGKCQELECPAPGR
eukprot:scaffold46691_cov19-Tisochrysis_lutea.AAC.3